MSILLLDLCSPCALRDLAHLFLGLFLSNLLMPAKGLSGVLLRHRALYAPSNFSFPEIFFFSGGSGRRL
jgi:hypothetical protein